MEDILSMPDKWEYPCASRFVGVSLTRIVFFRLTSPFLLLFTNAQGSLRYIFIPSLADRLPGH